jgi:outer membrane protein assembly factor BamB
VADDTLVGPPRHMQWQAGPKWSRHHQLMGSTSGMISSGGRVFYVVDEAPRSISFLPPQWRLVARDAFNGALLWKRPVRDWWTSLWILKSGPFQLSRRIVAEGDRVYLPLDADAPLTALDAATGDPIRTYDETAALREVLVSDGALFAVVRAGDPVEREPTNLDWISSFRDSREWAEIEGRVVALDAASGEVLWTRDVNYTVGTLAADARHVCLHDGTTVVCLDRGTGEPLWTSEPLPGPKTLRAQSSFMPSLVLYEDVVLFGGQKGPTPITALSADTGETLWSAKHPIREYAFPKFIFVANGLVWTGEMPNNRNSVFEGRDPRTGEVKKTVTGDVDTAWYHPRCFPPKATRNYLLTSHSGTEFVDIQDNGIEPHHWVRGSCSYGMMPANGLTRTD